MDRTARKTQHCATFSGCVRLGPLACVVALLALVPAEFRWSGHHAFAVDKGLPYGPHPLQFGDLLRPSGIPRGVAVLVHGGFWQGNYDRSLMVPIAGDLAERGFAVWNVEYRSVGTQGGYPETLDDVSLALDWLASDAAVSRGVSCGPAAGESGLPVAVIGHSAGGHLAHWLGLRPFVPCSVVPGPVGPVQGIQPRVVLAQAGVVDLRAAYAENLGSGAVKSFLGTASADEELRKAAVSAGSIQDLFIPPRSDAEVRFRAADPTALASAAAKGALSGDSLPFFGFVHGVEDTLVPLEQSRSLAGILEKAGAGARVRLQAIEGEAHFEHLQPQSRCWQATVDVLAETLGVELTRV